MPGPRDPDENRESSYIKAKNVALRLLSYRSRSEKEVQRRLEGRFTQEAVDRFVEPVFIDPTYESFQRAVKAHI